MAITATIAENQGAVQDALLLLHDSASAITTTAAGLVGGSARILDIGSGYSDFKWVVDVSAAEVGTNDNIYVLKLQLSSSATFASALTTAVEIQLGHATMIDSDVAKSVGRYITNANNKFGDTVYRYVRIYTTITGTGKSITYKSWLAKP